MMVVLSVVFSHLFKFDIDNYPLYLLAGQVVFNFFSAATTMDMTAIIDNAPLIKKVYVPKYMFVLSRTVSSAINLMASFAALIIVMLCMRAELHYMALLGILIFGTHHGTYVPDTGNIPDVESSACNQNGSAHQSAHEYS